MNQDQYCRTELPKLMEINDVVKEGKSQSSFFFREKLDCKPGQFIMVWFPGVDEKPMAVSYHSKNEFAFTAQSIGNFTQGLEKLRKGHKLGIRGPYGNSFSLEENSCIVAGGIGFASLSTLAEALKNPLIIYGARDKDNLIYLRRFKNKNMVVATDDGSFGRKGYTTDVLDEILSKRGIKLVQTCGPEIMMKKVLDICNRHKVECKASVERYMSCGFGICGKCMINDKIACIDGPIFNSRQLNRMPEFGNYARLKSGRKVSLKGYHERR